MEPLKRTASTLLDALGEHLRGQASTADGVAVPAAILWTDPEGEWRRLIPALREGMPELLVHGAYDPERRTGPSIWLRCVVDRALAEPELPARAVPVLYLPGVSRQMLTAGEDCPVELQPLVDLLHRGVVWLQRGGHDWTVTAFLTSPQALGLDLARDAATRTAVLNALREVASAPLEQLRRGRLEAHDFESMLTSDVPRDLLRWIGEPESTKAQMEAERWAAFVAQAERRFGFKVEAQGPLKAAELLGRAEGAWAEVWQRFEDAPTAFPRVAEALRRCTPASGLFARSHWPQLNDKDEERVAAALGDLEGVPHDATCAKVLELEKAHAERRSWVWAKLGQSPLAVVLEPLAMLASLVQKPVAGVSPDEIARSYEAGAWRTDAAAWRALATVPVRHEDVVREVVQQLYEPWLEASAEAFQAAHAFAPATATGARANVDPPDGGCLMFVDGLRYDLGRELELRLRGRGCRAEARSRWAALPTVTATGKCAVTPVAADVVGNKLGADFAPLLRSGKGVDAASLRTAIAAKGYQLVDGDGGDFPAKSGVRGYVEYGDIDHLGHDLQASLPRQLDEHLERLAERIVRLLDAGWQSVRVVTDHGWLLLPEGLPQVDLPKHLTASRWARCAAIAGASQVDVPRVVWHWNPLESAAVAPGIACFNQHRYYAHGGLSVQECLTPDLLVEREGARAVHATIRSLTWRGMRCAIEAEASAQDVRVDLRHGGAGGASVVKNVKLLDADGSASLVVADDRFEHELLTLVLLGADGAVLAQRDTRVGEQS